MNLNIMLRHMSNKAKYGEGLHEGTVPFSPEIYVTEWKIWVAQNFHIFTKLREECPVCNRLHPVARAVVLYRGTFKV